MTAPTTPLQSTRQEPPMFLQRPSSARSQDVTHVLARTFRQLFTHDTVATDTIDNLHKSRGGEDEYHERYVAALKHVQDKRNRRMAEATMLERHIMQAQARAMSADERELNRVSSGYQRFPDLGLPPARSHFRSCIDSELLKKHGLITPEDFATEESPPVPPPQTSAVPSYALQTHTSSQKRSLDYDQYSQSIPVSGRSNDSGYMYSATDSDVEEPILLPRISDSTQPNEKNKNLWKKQMNPEQREIERADLANLQARVDYLKNPRHISPSATGGRTLVKQTKRRAKELGIKPKTEKDKPKEPSVVFVPSPEIVRFTEYNVGQVYEMTLELKNVSTVLRPLRVIPTKTTYFSSGLGQFPGDQGLVAPGMSCHFTIRFCPDSLGDFDDEIQLQTQSSVPLIIKVEGRRQPPELSLPSDINVGHCLIGGSKVCQFHVKNTGGTGRFCLMPRAAWPAANFKSIARAGTVEILPFEVRPSVFELSPDQSTMVQVIFKPGGVEKYTQQMTMVCDNCQVKHFNVIGEGQEAGVTLDTEEIGASEYLPGELPDVTAQHLVRFENLNPYTYVQRVVKVRNATNVELPFTWLVVKPCVVPSESETEKVIPTQRIQDVNSAFSIEPESGVLPPAGVSEFTLMFAPPKVKKYHNVLHMVLRDIPKSISKEPSIEEIQTKQEGNCGSPERKRSGIQRKVSEPTVCDLTSLEVEVKGECETLNVLLNPYAIYFAGQTLVETPAKMHFRMLNNSLSTIFFEWENLFSGNHVVSVSPVMGELAPQSTAELEVTVSGSVPGKVCHTLKCHVQHLSVPLYLPVEASIKGPEVVLEASDLNFGLVRQGQSATQTLTMRNLCQVSAKWSIRESPALVSSKDPAVASEYEFSPESGEMGPLETCDVSVTFTPSGCKSVRTVLELLVEDGNECNISVRGEVQLPEVCLLSCQLNLDDVYLDVPVTHQVSLVNQTLLDTAYEWGKVEGSQADLVSVSIEPKCGPLSPREELKVNVTLTAHAQGELGDLHLPCHVEGMDKPVYLALSCDVKGLSVTYRTSDDGQLPSLDEAIEISFGCDIALGSTTKRYVHIKNNSAITAPFSAYVEHFNAKPPTPPEKRLDSNMPNKSQRRAMLGRTQNLADPRSKSLTKAQQDLHAVMLQDGKGAAFSVLPASGLLQPFAEQVLEVSAFSNMWGSYTDRLICKVEKLELVYIPLQIAVTGCPLVFQMVASNSTKKPILRFGTHVSGMPPVSRQMRILNNSPFDVRLDWQMYDTIPNDRQLLDFVFAFGDPFPLQDSKGNVILPELEEPPSVERQPTDFIPNSLDTTPSLSRQPTENADSCEPESVESTPHPRRDIIRVFTRVHEGVEGTDNYSINPAQMIIPSKGSNCINVSYTPRAGVTEGIDCQGYAQGYMSLPHQVSHVEGKVDRLEGYDVAPIRLDMTAHVKPAFLHIECSEEEGMKYRTAASELLNNGQMLPRSLSVCSAVLVNQAETPLSFRLLTSEPFYLVNLDPVTREPISQLLQTDMITLKQRKNIKINVAFQVTLDLLDHLSSLESEAENSEDPDEKCPGQDENVTLEKVAQERRLAFRDNLIVHFQNQAEQVLPLYATIAVPSLVLSKEELDFGVCLVGQNRELELTVSNPTTSATFWTAAIESKSDDCTKDTFTITPSSGMLEANTSHISNSKLLLKVTFTSKHAEEYEAVFMFHGMLGEEPQSLKVKGYGSYDGKHEALVNV